MGRIPITEFKRWKVEGQRFVCLTAYDAPTARILESSQVPVILVGDSVGNVVLGYRDTTPVTMTEMLHHACAVRRGAPDTFVVGDMPFGSYQVSSEAAVRNAIRFVAEAGMDAVKVEGATDRLETIRKIISAGVPVMGHLGLTPQNVTQLGGFRVQATEVEAVEQLVSDAKALEESGAFSIVLECVPEEVAQIVTESVSIPTIGIGAGRQCDAQVLVFHDLIGISSGYSPRFVRAYASVEQEMLGAVKKFSDEVREGQFPGDGESFHLPAEKIEEVRRRVGRPIDENDGDRGAR